jgi:hypothetical protein
MSRRFGHNDLAADSKGNVHRPSALCVGHCDRLGRVVGIVAVVLSGLATQPGAIAVGGTAAFIAGHVAAELAWNADWPQRSLCQQSITSARRGLPAWRADGQLDDQASAGPAGKIIADQ